MLLNVYFYFFGNTCGYPWISMDIKKLCGYPTNMDTNTGQIFIQQIGYRTTTIRTLPTPLTYLIVTYISLLRVE